MKTYLVTGGAGFIGSNLVRVLLQKGKTVRVLDNLVTGRLENIAPILPDIEFIEADIREPDTVSRAAKGVDVILHQAALPSVMRSMIDPLTTNDVNINGTLNILMAARDAEVQRVVFASSSSVYGNSTALPKKESMCPAPLSPYAVSKLAAEYYCGVFTTTYGLSTIALRYFNVFGPQQDFASHYSAVIPRFISLMLRGERPFVYGDGHQTRDFTFVENVVTANLLAAEAPKHISGCFNIACGNRISVLRLIIKLNSLLGTALAPQYGPIRPGDVHDSQASVEKAEQILGFVPVVSFDSGLEQTIEYVREIQRGRCLP